MDEGDRKLFLKYLYLLNDADIESPSRNMLASDKTETVVHKLVNLCAFCLMPNHFHLLLYECTEGGISKFMQRLGIAYTMYFNEKYARSGGLFQGTFKSRLIEDEAYLMRTIDYLHMNPIQHKDEEGAKMSLRKNDFATLDTYPWSSYRDYCGEILHPHILQREVLHDYIKLPKDYRAWLLEQNDFTDLGSLAIDG